MLERFNRLNNPPGEIAVTDCISIFIAAFDAHCCVFT